MSLEPWQAALLLVLYGSINIALGWYFGRKDAEGCHNVYGLCEKHRWRDTR